MMEDVAVGGWRPTAVPPGRGRLAAVVRRARSSSEATDRCRRAPSATSRSSPLPTCSPSTVGICSTVAPSPSMSAPCSSSGSTGTGKSTRPRRDRGRLDGAGRRHDRASSSRRWAVGGGHPPADRRRGGSCWWATCWHAGAGRRQAARRDGPRRPRPGRRRVTGVVVPMHGATPDAVLVAVPPTTPCAAMLTGSTSLADRAILPEVFAIARGRRPPPGVDARPRQSSRRGGSSPCAGCFDQIRAACRERAARDPAVASAVVPGAPRAGAAGDQLRRAGGAGGRRGRAPAGARRLVLPNGPDLAVAFLGAVAGGGCAPLAPDQPQAQYERELARSARRRRGRAAVTTAPPARPRPRRASPVVESSARRPAPSVVRRVDAAERGVLLLFTSGTTSAPKLVAALRGEPPRLGAATWPRRSSSAPTTGAST